METNRKQLVALGEFEARIEQLATEKMYILYRSSDNFSKNWEVKWQN